MEIDCRRAQGSIRRAQADFHRAALRGFSVLAADDRREAHAPVRDRAAEIRVRADAGLLALTEVVNALTVPSSFTDGRTTIGTRWRSRMLYTDIYLPIDAREKGLVDAIGWGTPHRRDHWRRAARRQPLTV